MRTTWSFHTAGQLVFGPDAVNQLGEIVRRMGVSRALVITDVSLVAAGVVERIRAALISADVAIDVFDGGLPEPPISAVEAALRQAQDFTPGVLIGLGGGSNMDIAKAAATVLAHGGSVIDYAGDQVVPGPVFPLVLIPTTAGTGSEVSAASVLADPSRGIKFSILSNHLRPRVALVDPTLTLSCPAKVTAQSGIDALSHAVEAYMAVDNEVFPLPDGERTVYQGRHPMGDLLAERAIALIGENLRAAVADGSNRKAREGMSLAATLAGMAFSNTGVAVVHALEYALGEVSHTPHGVGCGVLLPFVMQFNAPARPGQMARIAELLGADITGLDDEAAAGRAVEAVQCLKADIGIPVRLRDVGVRAEHLPSMAQKASGVKRILRVNPRPVSFEDLESILRTAL